MIDMVVEMMGIVGLNLEEVVVAPEAIGADLVADPRPDRELAPTAARDREDRYRARCFMRASKANSPDIHQGLQKLERNTHKFIYPP